MKDAGCEEEGEEGGGVPREAFFGGDVVGVEVDAEAVGEDCWVDVGCGVVVGGEGDWVLGDARWGNGSRWGL